MSPEYSSGLIGRMLFSWVIPILAKANYGPFHVTDLPCLDEEISSINVGDKVFREWESRERPENTWTLLFVLLRALRKPLIAPISSRLFLALCRFAQPVLIGEAVQYVSGLKAGGNLRADQFGILAGVVLAGAGQAISTSMYEHRLGRLRLATRASLNGLIYRRVMDIYDDTEKGTAVTLMGADCDTIDDAGSWCHTFCAYALEACFALWLICREISVVSFLPFGFLVVGLFLNLCTASRMRGRQKNWSTASQERIRKVGSTIRQIDSLKSLSLGHQAASRIQTLRRSELAVASQFRQLQIASEAIASMILNLTPALTVAAYLLYSKGPLDSEKLFKVLALLGIFAHCTNKMAMALPLFLSGLVSYERIQDYLVKVGRIDHRILLDQGIAPIGESNTAISLRGVVLHDPRYNAPLLQDVDLEIMQQSIVLCHGPVGSGKSLLAKAILGEFPISRGTITLFSQQVGYCDQNPWLPNGTIRDVICGFEARQDEVRYQEAVNACSLDHDLLDFPDGDSKVVGSAGKNLSGGQRQRVALARLVYSHSDIVILDNGFSALDRKTRCAVIDNLLGPKGIFRRRMTTVLWICGDVEHTHLASQLLIVKDSRIVRSRKVGLFDANVIDSIAPGNLKTTEINRAGNCGDKYAELNSDPGKMRVDAQETANKNSEPFLNYAFYFRKAGLLNTVVMFCSTGCCSLCLAFSYYWLKWWATSPPDCMTGYAMGYMGLALAGFLFSVCGTWAIYSLMASTAGETFHAGLLRTIMNAPLSYFFTNHHGNTLNLFTQDVQVIDKTLPTATFVFISQMSKLGIQILLLQSLQKNTVFLFPACFAVFYSVQKIYMQSFKSLQLLYLGTRSDVFSSYLETVEGATTIRTLRLQETMISRNRKYFDLSQQAFYTVMSLKRWLNLMLGLAETGMTLVVISLAFSLKDQYDAVAIGVCLKIVFDTARDLRVLVDSWLTLEISLSAVDRLRRAELYTPQESTKYTTLVPDAGWPLTGEIEIKNLTVSFNSSTPTIDKLTLKISAGQKVIICGRTGSGKSTLLLSLLRLVDYSGSILIDGVNIAQLPVSLVREHCFLTVPQDAAIIVSESLRNNLDPTGVAAYEELTQALVKTGLWDCFVSAWDRRLKSSHVANSILDLPLEMLPPMSNGQHQLLSIARLLVRRDIHLHVASRNTIGGSGKPVILLDEATSSLDPITEREIDRLLDEEFICRGYTVIQVTHKPEAAVGNFRQGKDAILCFQAGGVTSLELCTSNGQLR
ncbi:P-loop containing nucleoside triphosphate hydrolase protein [Hyaloscypha variabilis]